MIASTYKLYLHKFKNIHLIPKSHKGGPKKDSHFEC